MKTQYTLFLSLLLFAFTTNNAIQAQSYCTASGSDSNEEWIQSISIDDFTNTSDNSNGYGNYTSQIIDLEEESTYSLSLTPGFSDNNYTEYWKVWIDYNDDGDFNDTNELIFDSEEGTSSTLTGNFTTPNISENLNTRMRVAMKFVGEFNDGTIDNDGPDPCGEFVYGEVEDYTVNIQATVVQEVPVAAFNYNVAYGQAPLTVNFTNQSSNANTFNWSFPGGSPNTSSLANPSVVYNNPGVYSVFLTVTNAAGTDTHTMTNLVTVEAPVEPVFPPITDFTSSMVSPNVPLTIQFTDLSLNNPIEWNWTFPGGIPAASTAQNPVVVYNVPGVYDVILTASNEGGTDQQISYEHIVIEPPLLLPIADFSASTTIGTAPLEVNFLDQSINNPTGWNWSFEGANITNSNQQNPTAIYTEPGTYAVTLTCTNPLGADVETQSAYITVLEPEQPPVVAFGASITEGHPPLTVTFFDLSTNNPTDWEWEFPGASPSSSDDKSPTVTYNTAGTFPVTLEVTNEGGSNSKIEIGYINVIPVVLGVDDVEWTAKLHLYPNPAHEFLNIELALEEPSDLNYSLFNLLGQEIVSKELNNVTVLNEQVALSDVPSGSYILSIDDGVETVSKMIQVVK